MKGIIFDKDYMNLVKAFQVLRIKNHKHQRSIEVAAGTGGGRVSNFEGQTYTPRLITFVKWCRAAGIEIHLSKTPPPNNKNLIDQIKDEKTNKK